MTSESSFPEQTQRLVRFIRFILTHFWLIMSILGGIVVCCALAQLLEVCLSRPHAITLAVIFTLVAWVLICIMAILRLSHDTPSADPPSSLPF
ncbi:MAG TPA: hypothetical protein VGN15_06265 [Ktedonobacteraceae bacterium]|jgi:type VI protein secretion system component VasK|nr:hypothetical protein [Ktedonobacteraceae bacterium]